jgi:hypothetical protein
MIKAISMFAVFCFAQAAFACDAPNTITVPNGATATKEELVAAQKAVKAFIADMDAYLACIVEEEKLARQAIGDLEPEAEQRREEMLDGKYNAGVDAEKRIEAAWNETVQAYKKRSE